MAGGREDEEVHWQKSLTAKNSRKKKRTLLTQKDDRGGGKGRRFFHSRENQ